MTCISNCRMKAYSDTCDAVTDGAWTTKPSTTCPARRSSRRLSNYSAFDSHGEFQ
jgi:hypothetical protein